MEQWLRNYVDCGHPTYEHGGIIVRMQILIQNVFLHNMDDVVHLISPDINLIIQTAIVYVNEDQNKGSYNQLDDEVYEMIQIQLEKGIQRPEVLNLYYVHQGESQQIDRALQILSVTVTEVSEME